MILVIVFVVYKRCFYNIVIVFNDYLFVVFVFWRIYVFVFIMSWGSVVIWWNIGIFLGFSFVIYIYILFSWFFFSRRVFFMWFFVFLIRVVFWWDFVRFWRIFFGFWRIFFGLWRIFLWFFLGGVMVWGFWRWVMVVMIFFMVIFYVFF